ncbi:MAG: hypothetical protein ABI580_03665 [Burkholderiaceae bacterium]
MMIRALVVMLCFFVGAANAATIDPLLAKSDVCGRFEVYHINGVMTDPSEAADNLNRIRVVYGNSYKEHLIVYRLAYNQHRSFLRDFYDSAMQIINLYAQATWDKWMNAVTFGIYSPFMDAATAQVIAKAVTDVWGFTKPNPYTDQEMNEILSVIVSGSSPHARKVLLPHSQGNFYASLVYDKLFATGHAAKSIGVVGLAVPYSSVRTGNVYITSAQDLVIDAVRVATLGNVLPANANIPYAPLVDVFGHNLIDTYMANSTVRSKYITLITNEFGTLKTTAPDPQQWIRVRSSGMICGADAYPVGYPGPYACYYDVPTGSYPQWFTNVNINKYALTASTIEIHAIGTPADLEPANRERMTGCYAWYLSDRKAVIKALGYVPTSQWYYPYHTHSGSCGAGFPWQTPWGNPDIAWMIYSADSSKTTSRSWTEPPGAYYNDIEMFPVCKRT